MDLSRTEYPSMLTSLQPTPAATVLRDRLRKGQSLNTEVADWLQERRRVEELYAQGLMKLAKKQPPGEQSELGIFRTAWDRIINSTSQLANSHLHLAQKIETEVERPLRDFATTNKDWAGLKTYEGNLTGIAKQIDSAEDKADKLRRKGARAQATRVAEAAAAVEKAIGDWESQAPFVFEKLQAVDETRCNNLRDCLTQYHTLEVDQAQRAMQLANESLGTLLDLNTIDEIKTFTETVTHGKPKIERQGTRPPTTTASGMPSSTPSVVTDDSVSVQSAGSGGGSGSGLGGLRRLGTVFHRSRPNRNSTVPYQRSSSPIRSSERLPSRREGPPMTPASPKASDFTSTSSRNLSVPVPSSPSIHEPPSTPKANGVSKAIPDQNEASPPSTADASQPLPPMPTVSVTDEPQKDSEGFTIPPPVTDIGGIPLEDNAEQTQPQFKLEIKNDVIPEEEEEADAAMSKVASHLRMQNTVTRKNRGRRDARDVRNTLFYPAGTGPPDPLETLSSPNNTSIHTNSSPPMSPLKVPRAAPALPSEASDTQSIRSSRSVTSLTGGAIVRHPELHEPGLTASLVELVNVNFEAGQPTKVSVMGEIALAYNPRDMELLSPPSSQVVKLDNFSVLEKVAPNPAFITAIPEKAGEYTVSFSHLHRTTVAFKYQVHLEESGWADYLPIIVSPVWRMEPHQASVILNYKLNPNYHRLTASGTPITLRNITFITGIEGVVPISCQSKPVGTFSREMGRIAWRLDEIVLDEASATGKLVARFMIDAGAGIGAKHAPSELRWEVVGDEANGAGSSLSLSGLEKVDVKEEIDPFADEETLAKAGDAAGEKKEDWKKLRMVRKFTSGKYCGA